MDRMDVMDTMDAISWPHRHRVMPPTASFRAVCLACMGLFAAVGALGHDLPIHPAAVQPVAMEPVVPVDGPTRQVTLRVVDAKTGAPLPAVLRVRRDGGAVLALPGLLPRATGISAQSFGESAHSHLASWYVLDGEAEVLLPGEALTIEAMHGLEYARGHAHLESGAESAEIRLNRVYNRADAGLVAGNVHLHLQQMAHAEALHYAGAVARADGLDMVFVSYLERAEADAEYTSNHFTRADLAQLSAETGVVFGWGEEYRHNFHRQAGYGHAMILDLARLILPASLGPDITKMGDDSQPLRPGLLQARAQQATLLWCHNRMGHEDIPSWVAGILDGQIVFDQGSVGGYEDGFYGYLNVGLQVPLATGTDWFYRDMAMTYVEAPQPVTTATWLEALRAGKSFITNGPLLDFRVNGRGPGAALAVDRGGSLTAAVEAVGQDDFGAVELVVNGHVVASAATTRGVDRYTARLETPVTANEPLWIAARVAPFDGPYDRPEPEPIGFNAYGKPLFAHTSPVYVAVDGEGVFDEDAARGLIAELEESKATIAAVGQFADATARNNVIALYDEAIATLEARITQHKGPATE